MEYTYETKNTCSKAIRFDLDGDVVRNVKFLGGGCPGNLQALPKLVEGLSVEEIEKRIGGIICGMKGTSCADQLAKAVRKAYEESKKLA
ncbi:MAG: TIGR03905 family TSCPD domain-containing protein [Clostridia bacterium]|nr:TIGR03905 family TSCPD domain-containing protein [Clostridia bacterium]